MVGGAVDGEPHRLGTFAGGNRQPTNRLTGPQPCTSVGTWGQMQVCLALTVFQSEVHVTGSGEALHHFWPFNLLLPVNSFGQLQNSDDVKSHHIPNGGLQVLQRRLHSLHRKTAAVLRVDVIERRHCNHEVHRRVGHVEVHKQHGGIALRPHIHDGGESRKILVHEHLRCVEADRAPEAAPRVHAPVGEGGGPEIPSHHAVHDYIGLCLFTCFVHSSVGPC
mmetsp:Transcript_16167/g.26022  ORF Transcript_16167/g.26022 Transcript_16167/m.26022 type:complete len:221 (-) Transcript_16167:76-738(-)